MRHQITVKQKNKSMYFDLETKNTTSLKTILNELVAYDDIEVKEYIHKDYSTPPKDIEYNSSAKIKVSSNIKGNIYFKTFKIHNLKKNIQDTFIALATDVFQLNNKKPDKFLITFIS